MQRTSDSVLTPVGNASADMATVAASTLPTADASRAAALLPMPIKCGAAPHTVAPVRVLIVSTGMKMEDAACGTAPAARSATLQPCTTITPAAPRQSRAHHASEAGSTKLQGMITHVQQQKNLSAVMENARTGSSKHRHERRHRQALCQAGSAPSLCFAFLVV